MSLSDFGINITTTLQKQREEFIERYGWNDGVLADYGIMIRPNTPLVEGSSDDAGWNPRYQDQLRGHNYADIVFCDLSGAPLMTSAYKSSIEIPYRRARLLDFKGTSGKYQSYKGTGVALYLPHNYKQPDYWVDVAVDATQHIVITEGEFDAISAHLRGMPCIGITGVD